MPAVYDQDDVYERFQAFLSASLRLPANGHILALTAGDDHILRNLAPNAQALMIEAGAGSRSHLRDTIPPGALLVACERSHLPLPAGQFDLVVCLSPSQHASSAESLLDETVRVLKTGGAFVLLDTIVPDDQRAARYVNAFHRLRSPRFQQAHAAYEWEGKLLNAGLSIIHSQVTTSREPVITSEPIAPDIVARLHILLAQAPKRVHDFWQPACAGTHDASFDQSHLFIAGSK
jgi:SAM-dependent methyltransferase